MYVKRHDHHRQYGPGFALHKQFVQGGKDTQPLSYSAFS